jgi:hypothetical protein
MTPGKGNAHRGLAAKVSANTKQREIADVSIAHTGPFRYPDPFDPTALALAQMVVEDRDRAQGMTTDDDAVAQLIAAHVPIEVSDMEMIDGKVVTYWAICWLDDIDADEAERWFEQFREGLDEIRVKATGADRLALERVDFYFSDPQYRSQATRRCLPTAATYSAIAARAFEEHNDAWH